MQFRGLIGLLCSGLCSKHLSIKYTTLRILGKQHIFTNIWKTCIYRIWARVFCFIWMTLFCLPAFKHSFFCHLWCSPIVFHPSSCHPSFKSFFGCCLSLKNLFLLLNHYFLIIPKILWYTFWTVLLSSKNAYFFVSNIDYFLIFIIKLLALERDIWD